MKEFLCLMLSTLPLVAVSFANAEPSRISYHGGDGSSFEKAVIIKGATEQTGVHAEYEYLAKHYPGYKRGKQSLQEHKGKMFDVLELNTADGQSKTMNFD